MRSLFLVLILANVGFGFWTTWYSGAEQLTRPIDGDGAGIEIYQSDETAPVNGTAPDSALPSPISDAIECISVGPLPNRVDVEDTVRLLANSGFASRQRTAQGEVWLGYWVYIDAISTQAEAADIVRRLSQNGISEAYVIAEAENGNIVSLGVFSVQDRAQQRFSDASALGLTPVISNRSQPGEVFWLDVTAATGAPFVVADLPSLNIDPQLRFESCSASR